MVRTSAIFSASRVRGSRNTLQTKLLAMVPLSPPFKTRDVLSASNFLISAWKHNLRNGRLLLEGPSGCGKSFFLGAVLENLQRALVSDAFARRSRGESGGGSTLALAGREIVVNEFTCEELAVDRARSRLASALSAKNPQKLSVVVLENYGPHLSWDQRKNICEMLRIGRYGGSRGAVLGKGKRGRKRKRSGAKGSLAGGTLAVRHTCTVVLVSSVKYCVHLHGRAKDAPEKAPGTFCRVQLGPLGSAEVRAVLCKVHPLAAAQSPELLARCVQQAVGSSSLHAALSRLGFYGTSPSPSACAAAETGSGGFSQEAAAALVMQYCTLTVRRLGIKAGLTLLGNKCTFPPVLVRAPDTIRLLSSVRRGAADCGLEASPASLYLSTTEMVYRGNHRDDPATLDQLAAAAEDASMVDVCSLGNNYCGGGIDHPSRLEESCDSAGSWLHLANPGREGSAAQHLARQNLDCFDGVQDVYLASALEKVRNLFPRGTRKAVRFTLQPSPPLVTSNLEPCMFSDIKKGLYPRARAALQRANLEATTAYPYAHWRGKPTFAQLTHISRQYLCADAKGPRNTGYMNERSLVETLQLSQDPYFPMPSEDDFLFFNASKSQTERMKSHTKRTLANNLRKAAGAHLRLH